MKHGAFGMVLSAVLEQVANFKVTKYPIDGRRAEEIEFEKILSFDRRAGFIIPITKLDDSNSPVIADNALQVFLNMIVSLGDQKLIARGPKNAVSSGVENDANDDEDEDGDSDISKVVVKSSVNSGPSFRHDRRTLRLLIARYWANQLMSKLKAYQSPESIDK